MHTIELPKFYSNKEETFTDIAKRIKNPLDIWVTFFTQYEKLHQKELPQTLDKPELKKAVTILDAINLSPEEREIYEAYLKRVRDERSRYQYTEEQGIKKGLEMGAKETLKDLLFKKSPQEVLALIQQPFCKIIKK